MKCTFVKQKPADTSVKKKGVRITSSTTMSHIASRIRLMKAHLSVTTIRVQEVGSENFQHLYSKSQKDHFWFLCENSYKQMVEKAQQLSGEK